MLATTTVGPGPMSKAPSPVPQGCEQEKVPGTGMGMQEMTKMAEPTMATNAGYCGSAA